MRTELKEAFRTEINYTIIEKHIIFLSICDFALKTIVWLDLNETEYFVLLNSHRVNVMHLYIKQNNQLNR